MKLFILVVGAFILLQLIFLLKTVLIQIANSGDAVQYQNLITFIEPLQWEQSAGINTDNWFLQFIDCMAITLWFALAGAGDTRFTSFVGILSSWLIFVPLSYILGITLGFGIWGPWIAFGIHLFLEASLIIFRVNQGKWKQIVI